MPFTLPPAFSAPQIGRQAARLRWWEDFDDPQLNRFVETALEGNPGIAQAIARTRIAEAQARMIRADQLPQAGLRAGTVRQRQAIVGLPVVGPDGEPVETDTRVILSTRHDVALDVSWELDLWGRLSTQTAAARADYLASVENLRAIRQAIAAQAVLLYFGIVHARAQVELSARTADALSEMARQINNRVDAGIASPADGELANANLESARAGLDQRREVLARNLRQLEALMGTYPAGVLETPSILPDVPAAPAAGVPAELLARRPDVRAAELALLASGYRLNAAQRSFLPALSLSGAAAYGGSSLADLFSSSNLIWSIAGIILQPIFQGGRLQARVYSAEGQRDEMLHRYAETALNALTEVETILAVDRMIENREGALDSSASAAEEATRISFNRYMQGIDPFLNVLESQQRALNGRSAQIAAHFARLESRIALYLALGGGFEDGPLPSAVGATSVGPAAPSSTKGSRR